MQSVPIKLGHILFFLYHGASMKPLINSSLNREVTGSVCPTFESQILQTFEQMSHLLITQIPVRGRNSSKFFAFINICVLK